MKREPFDTMTIVWSFFAEMTPDIEIEKLVTLMSSLNSKPTIAFGSVTSYQFVTSLVGVAKFRPQLKKI